MAVPTRRDIIPTVEASTLGLHPSEWPRTIEHNGYTYTRSGAIYEGRGTPDAQLVAVRYINGAAMPNEIEVLND